MKHWCADFTLLSAVVSLKNIIYLSFMAARRLRGEKNIQYHDMERTFFFLKEKFVTFSIFFFLLDCKLHNQLCSQQNR